MKFAIRNRWTGNVQFECALDAEIAGKSLSIQLGFAVRKAAATGAVLSGADLSGAVLSGAVLSGAVLSDAVLSDADLSGAVLSGADLSGAVLSGAVLSGADLSGAVLSGADLRGADLSDAVLSGAVLSGADLRGADLRGADLSGAVLRHIRADFYDVLSWAPGEVPALIDALKSGRVDGSTYEGPCACLVGTIANAKGISYEDLEHDPSRPIEVFFGAIRQGDTPETNQVSAIALEWAEAWLANMRAAFGPKAA